MPVDWSAPKELFEKYNKEFNFNVDVCATPDTKKCRTFYYPKDGMIKRWTNKVCWLHPPHNKVGEWVKKACTEWSMGATVVALLPSGTDSSWFHKYVYNKARVEFLAGRLKKKDKQLSTGSMIAIYEEVDYTGLKLMAEEHEWDDTTVSSMVREHIPIGSMCKDSRGLCPFWDIDTDRPDHMCGMCRLTGECDWKQSKYNTYYMEDEPHRPVKHIPQLWDRVKSCNINVEKEE